jgi:transcriptional antiterminator RfaH
MESVFPCYIFVRCLIGQSFSDLQRAKGISSLVHFGSGIPAVEDSVIRELQECFGTKEPVQVREGLLAGDEVTVGAGAFAGMRAHVLREMPARRRVQILLDILGGPTPVDMDRGSVLSERSQAAGRVPILARG